MIHESQRAKCQKKDKNYIHINYILHFHVIVGIDELILIAYIDESGLGENA